MSDRAKVVPANPSEFEEWRETIKVRSDAELMDEIKKGLSALKKKGAKIYTLDELLSTE